MGPRYLFLFLTSVLWLAPLRADLRQAAYQAQALLGPDVWSRVIKLKNTQPCPGNPATTYALVFELEDRLWFYAASSGTESLSHERGQMESDKRALGPLLNKIYAGFGRYEELPVRFALEPSLGNQELPRGCFIEALVYFRQMLASGVDLDDARLLAYYGDAKLGAPGHTVLYFVQEGRRYFYDAAQSRVPLRLSPEVADTALAIARASVPKEEFGVPLRAVFLPLKILNWPQGETVAPVLLAAVSALPDAKANWREED